jgi:hypothetical protein
MKQSFNGNLILEPYKKTRQLEEHQAVTGFSMTKQKVGVEGLVLLVDASVDSKYFSKGTVFYFKEEDLYTKPWARKILESEEFPDGFVVGEMKDVIFVEDNND